MCIWRISRWVRQWSYRKLKHCILNRTDFDTISSPGKDYTNCFHALNQAYVSDEICWEMHSHTVSTRTVCYKKSIVPALLLVQADRWIKMQSLGDLIWLVIYNKHSLENLINLMLFSEKLLMTQLQCWAFIESQVRNHKTPANHSKLSSHDNQYRYSGLIEYSIFIETTTTKQLSSFFLIYSLNAY